MSQRVIGVPAPIPFNFNSTEVRIVMRDGQPWFVAQDVCKALGYANSRKAIADHLDDDEKGVTNRYTLGGEQQLSIINESGLYALVLRSRKPEARKFAKWVTSEVLPSIRTTGQFNSQPEAKQPDIDVRALLLNGCQKPIASLPPEVRKALDKKTFELAHEAFELLQQYMLGRVARHAEYGSPVRINVANALYSIERTTLGNALATTYLRQLSGIANTAESLKHLTDQFFNDMQALVVGGQPDDEVRDE